jgi:hypothetical protein
MQILDCKAPYLEGKIVFAPQSAIANLKLGTRPKGGSPKDQIINHRETAPKDKVFCVENAPASAFPVVRLRRTGLASELQ